MALWCGGRCAARAGEPWKPWLSVDSWVWALPAMLSRYESQQPGVGISLPGCVKIFRCLKCKPTNFVFL